MSVDLCTCDWCKQRYEKYHRIAAFGAIRRAVQVARECDYLVERANGVRELEKAEITGVVAAASIRYAIRAAIESEKAS